MGNTAAAPAQQEAWGPCSLEPPGPGPGPLLHLKHSCPNRSPSLPAGTRCRRHSILYTLLSRWKWGAPQGVKDWSTPTFPRSLPHPAGLQRLSRLTGSFLAWPACALGEAGVLGFLLRGLPAGEAASADFSPARGDQGGQGGTTGGGRSWQGCVCVCEHRARLRSTAACRTEACAAGPQYRLPLPLFPWRRRRRRGRPRGSLPSKFSALQVSPGGCLGWRTVVPAARLGECSLEKGLCAGEEEKEVGDPGMPRWPRWVSPCLWGQGALPMGKRGFWESSRFSSAPTPPDSGLLASPSWREMQPLGSYRPLGSQGEMVSSR